MKILVADDSSFMRKVIRNLLVEAGFSDFVEAGDGAEALRVYQEHKPDVVLLDIIMPSIQGVDVLKDLVKQGAKVIMVSAVGQESTIEEALKIGAKQI